MKDDLGKVPAPGHSTNILPSSGSRRNYGQDDCPYLLASGLGQLAPVLYEELQVAIRGKAIVLNCAGFRAARIGTPRFSRGIRHLFDSPRVRATQTLSAQRACVASWGRIAGPRWGAVSRPLFWRDRRSPWRASLALPAPLRTAYFRTCPAGADDRPSRFHSRSHPAR
jgi:hypothetical protein